jgi:hypothetical protein
MPWYASLRSRLWYDRRVGALCGGTGNGAGMVGSSGIWGGGSGGYRIGYLGISGGTEVRSRADWKAIGDGDVALESCS